MRLGEIMTRGVKTAAPAESAEDAYRRMRLHRIRHLVVMGTHGRRGIAHAIIGSVAERVVRLSTVPVLTVRSRPAK